MDISELLKEAVQRTASDLHIIANAPPVFRINGELILSQDYPILKSEDTKKLIYGFLSDSQKVVFEEKKELDFSINIPKVTRFRVNVHMQRGNVEAALRIVPLAIPVIEELNLPEIVKTLINKPNGIIIVTGPTGMGKTTTLAALVDRINEENKYLIITVEDPIEYIHTNKQGVIKQREVGSDTLSFANALKYTLRQDPDVISVGEMRDLETISTALTAAETGHLVLTTLHTPDASQTIDRIIDVFPPYQQQQIKIQLSGCLQAIISQVLLPRADKEGRILATEILVATSAIRALIREQRTEQIPSSIQTGAQFGMQSMDKSLKELYQKGLITYEIALSHAKNPLDFKKM
ncbi:MAG: type IV pilus twitching motility protein PilT [Candidatus Omnitrophica bacterium]|nr:type IV pilus twitching motility protein PilT [Candidatus Omnitrophota bacterium]MBU1047740.1 type IV pilus twitching motility protein PilT [Candidatus Omnitrophota bacterium]MBU1630895.1 type IV pilus twitching motility protein PilT [Candidatus Omnitrophota bacterium]MBU1767612.1 type IV pilus twitching motility protein PilT [Candidatus Omnitrophota bacterium]MBU1889362.1 type IV pilus twitching motility protein PilT [Candidatus Omnitrophota bacterium]